MRLLVVSSLRGQHDDRSMCSRLLLLVCAPSLCWNLHPHHCASYETTDRRCAASAMIEGLVGLLQRSPHMRLPAGWALSMLSLPGAGA
jgi:hypothetical protein